MAGVAAAREIGEPPRIAPHAPAALYYIVAQTRGAEQAIATVRDLMATTEIVAFDHKTAQRGLALAFGDFEDAMIAAAAEAAGLDCIVTRSGADFK